MTSTDVLIVGASQAGLQLATSLRDLGATGRITLVGGETRAPYQRPPLSKAFLQGKLADDSLALRGPEFFEAQGIELVCGEWIDHINLSDPHRGAGEATSRGGRVFGFDRLALTVGGTPRRIDVPGADLAGVHHLRDVQDSLGLRRDLESATRVVVVGGGFIGLEAAAAASAAGKDVTVVEAADRLLGRAVDPIMSSFYATAHERRGATVLLGTAVTGLAGAQRVEAVELADGRLLPADLVIIGVGLAAQTDLAQQLGLACDRGIIVDEAQRTSIPSVLAAGDCTVVAHPERGPLRLESVQNAINQAKIAAATLLGAPTPHTGVPWFWSDQADLKLQIAGLNAGYDTVVLRGDPATESFSLLYYRGEELLSIDSVNAPRDYMAVRRILDNGGSVPPYAATDLDVPLKEFLTVAV